MTYVRVTQLPSGGTFTTGAGANWHTQFDTATDAIVSAVPTVAGEMFVSSSLGVCADMALWASQPFDLSVYIELPSSAKVQVHINDAITEITVAGAQTFSFVRGVNVIRLISSTGDLILRAKLWGSDATTCWLSLYEPGADPFVSSGPVGSNPTNSIVATAP